MTKRGLGPRLLGCLVLALAGYLAADGWAPAGVRLAGAAPFQSPAANGEKLEEAYRWNNRGVAQLEQYDYEGAAASFEKALAGSPTLQLARINLAIAHLHAGKLPEAQSAAEQARAADPNAPQPHYVLGLVARANNEPDVAASAFERVLAIDARDLGALVNLGQLRIQERRYDDAVGLFKRAVEVEPYHVTAAYNLSVALTRAGQADEAARAVARFQELRASAYGTAFSNNYLERGRYAVALVSTGAESDLVDRAVPPVTFVAVDVAAAANGAPSTGDAAAGRASATLADLDHDGRLDLLTTGPAGPALFTNDGKQLRRVTGDAAPPWPAGPSSAVAVADYDNDHEPDIALATASGLVLLRQARPGHFYEVGRQAVLAGAAGVRTLAFVDTDHDGDVDLVTAGAVPGVAPGKTSVHLFRNDGTGTYTDATVDAGLDSSGPDEAIVPTDFDNRRDVDLLFLARDGAPRLMRNLRDGRFADAARQVGLAAPPGGTAVTAGDVNKDGFTDFFIASATESRFEMSDGTGRFRQVPGPTGSAGARAALLLDYDNDGLLDLVASVGGSVRVWRNVGREWQDVTERVAGPTERAGSGIPFDAAALAAGDLDGDGDIDLVAVSSAGAVRWLRNDGGNRQASITVRLKGRVSNKSGIGANVEVRAGSLWQKLEFSAASPAVAPSGLTIGLGARPGADVVRVLWPSGILQAETIDGAAGRAGLEIEELDRKPSSCPFLFTWTGTRFEFLTDFLGGGEMGYLHAPGVRSVPDPDEYVRIPADRLVPRDGRLELRVTNELEETLFLDRLQLLAVSHPAGVEVFPAEGLTSPPYRPFGLYAAPALRAPVRALDDDGRDVTEALRAVDRTYVDGFALEPIRGYAKPHALTIDLADPVGAPAALGPGAAAPRDGRTLLVLTGWTDYAFSSDNVAAHQAGIELQPPSLQVKDAAGRWQTVLPEIPIPVGRPQPVVVDLTGRFLSASREVRILTSMRIYWDQAGVDTSGRATFVAGRDLLDGREVAGLSVTRLEPTIADLSWRGFSAEVRPDGRGPLSYDYERVTADTPWKLMPGLYTRTGDVRELLQQTDDLFVVSRPGDQVAVAFDVPVSRATRPGRGLTYFLFAHGYSKEMDLSSASPDQVAPLPFRGMTKYPYDAPEQYPDTPEHRAYLDRYNTRAVGRMLPSLVAPRSDPAVLPPSSAQSSARGR